MSTQSLVPIDVYLHTSYHPDRDSIDGEVTERNLDRPLIAIEVLSPDDTYGGMIGGATDH
ncbi:MAG TPA: hypothetical protein VGD64_15415 [Acidisarcina sp.]